MTTAAQRIADLASRGVHLAADGDALRVQAARGVLNDSDRQWLKGSKPAILAALRSTTSGPTADQITTPAAPCPICRSAIFYATDPNTAVCAACEPPSDVSQATKMLVVKAGDGWGWTDYAAERGIHEAIQTATIRPPHRDEASHELSSKVSDDVSGGTTNELTLGAETCRRCGETEYRDVDIHDGRSTRRDCAKCGLFIRFIRWYGADSEARAATQPEYETATQTGS